MRRPAATVAVLGALAAIATATALAVGARTAGGGPPVLGGCRVFPAGNTWNRDISRLPVHPRSAAFVRAFNAGGNRFLHADFGGGGQYGIPYVTVPATQPRVPIRFTDYGDESDRGPYPVPLSAPVEGGSDAHVLVLQRGRCKLYELYAARRSGRGWAAGSGAVWDLDTGRLRPRGWTSADAAGLPILPGLARYDEVRRGEIRHALRVTVRDTQAGYILPATHFASSSRDPNLPPMGLRLRLRRGYPLGRFHGQALVILRALKRYGLIVADNGAPWYITGARDRRWNDEHLDQLKTVPGSAFEAVSTGPVLR